MRRALPLLLLLAACDAPDGSALGDGTLTLTDVSSSGGYRLIGTLAITDARHAVREVAVHGHVSLPAGNYRWHLQPGWRVFHHDGQRELDVTELSALRAAGTGPLAIAPNTAQHLTLAFNVEREPVDFDPCQPDPNAVDCTTWDSDHDSIANGVECPHGGRCVDSDRDGLPDHLDRDSDQDGLADHEDPARLDACTPARSSRCMLATN